MRMLIAFLIMLGACADLNDDESMNDPDFVSVNPDVVRQALGTPRLFLVINSEGGEKIYHGERCDVSPGHREFSCQLHSAVRSLSMSRHTGKGPNTYRDCVAGFGAQCKYAFALNTNERLFIDNCRVPGIPPTTLKCDFGTNTVLTRSVEGEVNITPELAFFYFKDGARGEAHFVEDAYWFTPAK